MDMPLIIHTILEGKWIFNSGASYYITKIRAFLKNFSSRQTKSILRNKILYLKRKQKKRNFPSQVGNAKYF
jgi:hypothetical protein